MVDGAIGGFWVTLTVPCLRGFGARMGLVMSGEAFSFLLRSWSSSAKVKNWGLVEAPRSR